MASMLLHVVADYGTGDLAFAEVAQRFALVMPNTRVISTAVPPFATLSAGFVVAQLALNDGPSDRAVFHNVAPRRDDEGVRAAGDGERLVHATLPNGVQVVGVHAGYAFSFLQEAGAILHDIDVPSKGSQFRSRDLFPAATASALAGAGLLGRVPASAVPAVPEDRVAYTDGFGNIKTTLEADRVPPPGTPVTISVAGVQRDAVVAGGSFAVPHGTLTLAPGSSGYARADGDPRVWLELFLRGGSAAEAFGWPPPQSTVHVEPR